MRIARLLLLLALLAVPVTADAPRWELGLGTFDVSGLEGECYYAVGQSTMIVFHPKSTYCEIAKNELRGRRGRLVFLIE